MCSGLLIMLQILNLSMAPKNNTFDNTINTEPDLTSLVNFVNRKKAGNSADFNIPTISEREVLEIVKSAPSNAATGLDGISSPLLKLIAPAAVPSLAKVTRIAERRFLTGLRRGYFF